MADSGFFGGLSSGLGAAQDARLAQQKQDAVEQQQADANVDAQINNAISVAQDTVKAAAAQGIDPQKVTKAVQPLIDAAAGLAARRAQRNGQDPQEAVSRIQAMGSAIFARPAAEEDTQHAPVVIGEDQFGAKKYAILEKKSGKLRSIDEAMGTTPQPAPAAAPVPGQPALTPEETITPRQAALANPPSSPVQVASLNGGPVSDRFGGMAPPARPAGTAVAQAGGTPGTGRNEDFLATLPAGAQRTIQGLSDGTLSLKDFSTKGGHRERVMDLVKQYDPSFDAVNAPARAATYKAFTSGVEARKVTALGTVLGHISELDKAGQALDNYKTDTFGVGTKAVNAGRTWALENKQDPRIKAFNATADAVANELETAFRQSNTALAGIQEWRKALNASMSPEEMRDTNKALGKLLGKRLNELNEQFDRGMGLAKDQAIATKLGATRQLIDRLGTTGSIDIDNPKSAPAAAPASGGWSVQRVQ